MFLHIGNNKNLRKKNIIGIFDMDNATQAQITRRFMADMEHRRQLVNVTDQLPKTFILCDGDTLYLSQLSTHALMGRIEN